MQIKLSPSQVQAALMSIPDWSQTGNEIARTFLFADFISSMRFVNQIAQDAERTQHHPDILVRYNRVTLTLSTHDAGGLTMKDFDAARAADAAAHA